MNNLLQKLLKNVGVTEFSQLSESEKETYRAWDESLAGRKLTDEDVALFFDSELEMSLEKLISKSLSEREDTFLKVKIDFIRKAKSFLSGPEKEKKMLEINIKNQLQ